MHIFIYPVLPCASSLPERLGKGQVIVQVLKSCEGALLRHQKKGNRLPFSVVRCAAPLHC
jgi:hypothetical protein